MKSSLDVPLVLNSADVIDQIVFAKQRPTVSRYPANAAPIKQLEKHPLRRAILLGESEVDKTRIALEFYKWLSRTEDPAMEDLPDGYRLTRLGERQDAGFRSSDWCVRIGPK